MNKELINIAREFAIEKHNEVCQKYGGYLPYTYHLELAAAVAQKYKKLIPDEDWEKVLSAVYLHDALEDCHVTYNDLVGKVGREVAEIVYAVTNEKGRTRKERASDTYYQGIRNTKYATFVKLCDRMANMIYSCMFGSSQFEMYKKEMENFKYALFNGAYDKVWLDLELLAKTKTFGFEPYEV